VDLFVAAVVAAAALLATISGGGEAGEREGSALEREGDEGRGREREDQIARV